MGDTDRPKTRVRYTIGSDHVEVESDRMETVAHFIYVWIAARRTGLTGPQEDKFQVQLDAALSRLEKTAE